MEEKKKGSRYLWLFWFFLLSPVLYILSFGPVTWMTASDPEREDWGCIIIYAPLAAIVAEDHESWPGKVLTWWMKFGVREGETVAVPYKLDGSSVICVTK